MNSRKSECLGIDLTQNAPYLAVASGADKAECSVPVKNPPAALLPILQGESLIAGEAAHNHRRGMGDRWPPECQVPVNGQYENGSGRVPLVCAWTRLSNLSTHKFSGFLGDTAVSWQPPGQKRLYSSAEKIIAASVQAWEKKYQTPRTVVVVPDNLGEAAQQALVDNCGSFLIPRPIAVAMSWCRKNAHNFSAPDHKTILGKTLGHLLVVTMPFDQWEVVPIEVRVMVYNDKLWLVPIRNRIDDDGDFPRIGVNFFMAMMGEKCASSHDIWRGVFGSKIKSPDSVVNEQITQDMIKSVRACMRNGISLSAETFLYNIKPLSELFLQRIELCPEAFKERLVLQYTRQRDYLPTNAKSKCLGIVVDGACATVPIAENKFTLGDFIAKAFGEPNVQIGNGGMAAYGAAITSYALEHKLPSYRETIIPVDIHYHGKNEKGDAVNAYKQLVEGTTVKAGEEYKSKKAVRGLQIKQGEKKLTLTLRRSDKQKSYLFRRVTAEIPKPTTRDEEVKIVAHLRPGQGFAKIFINSVHQAVFNTRLDWRTMEDCEKPAPPPLAYLPEVSRVVQDKIFWSTAKYYVEDAINKLNLGGNVSNAMDTLRLDAKFNSWPMADAVDNSRGVKPKNDIFRHYGVCPSDGDLASTQNSRLLRDLAYESGVKFVDKNTSSGERKKIQQAISWMYLACPPVIINQVRKNLQRNLTNIKQEDLHTIGLCWCEFQDLELFFSALEKRLLQDTLGVNNWLRACRNIVRFRDAALHPDIIPDNRVKIIIIRIIKILEGQERNGNFNTIFNNCILTTLYLLKRRRYNKEFLNSDSQEASAIDTVLDQILKKQSNNLSHRQHTIINVTLKFLRKEANLKDLDDSVLTG